MFINSKKTALFSTANVNRIFEASVVDQWKEIKRK